MTKGIISFMVTLLTISSVFAQDWQTNLENAKQLATSEKKAIVMVFQGSDWCAPCIKLDRKIWSSETFKNYAKEHFVMVKADFPRRKKNKLPKAQTEANAKLAEKYNTNGTFPLVVIMNHKGEVLGKTGYKKVNAEEYIKHLNAFID